MIGLGRRFEKEIRRGVETARVALVKVAFSMTLRKRRQVLRATRPTSTWTRPTSRSMDRRSEAVPTTTPVSTSIDPIPPSRPSPAWHLLQTWAFGEPTPRPETHSLIARAVAALPDGLDRPIIRADSGLFGHNVAEAVLANGADFAMAVKRSDAGWRTERKIPDGEWHRAIGMNREVAECDYVPGGWPKGSRTTCRG